MVVGFVLMRKGEAMDDVIKRQAAINTVHDMRKKCDTNNIDDYEEMLTVALEELCPVQRTGRWIDGKCNKCGTHAPYWAMASTYYCSEYCPHCGAYMVTEEEM